MVRTLRLTGPTPVTIPLAGQHGDPWCPEAWVTKMLWGLWAQWFPTTPHHCARLAPGVATSLLHDLCFLTGPSKCSRELAHELGGVAAQLQVGRAVCGLQ